ncbi:hypothetical protein FB45DRAFT_864364 [Roridomyces roridus]|uniref:Transmembrane protein n=1 Tax=Roridomyces roridus TaxID=1738132 RepID=A0AAD7C0Y5_9AGAR|nr:hypothetical protein FB45DRAFT_864364 [Roridomyces roridus]
MCRHQPQTHRILHNTLRLLYILGLLFLLFPLSVFAESIASDDPDLPAALEAAPEDHDPLSIVATDMHTPPIIIIGFILVYTLLEAATVFFCCRGLGCRDSRSGEDDLESQRVACEGGGGGAGGVGEYGACRCGVRRCVEEENLMKCVDELLAQMTPAWDDLAKRLADLIPPPLLAVATRWDFVVEKLNGYLIADSAGFRSSFMTRRREQEEITWSWSTAPRLHWIDGALGYRPTKRPFGHVPPDSKTPVM